MHGTVLFNGAPVSGGSLRLQCPAGRPSCDVDDQGRFQLELAAPGDYTWEWNLHGASFLGGPTRIEEPMALTIAIEGARIEGSARQRDGRPAGGVSIVLFGVRTRVNVETNESGGFTVPAFPLGGCSWRFEAGASECSGEFVIDHPGMVQPVLEEYSTRTIQLTVRGEPQPTHVTVRAIPDDERPAVTLVVTPSLSLEGRLTAPWPDHTSMGMISAEGHVDEFFPVPAGQSEFELVLTPGGNLQVYVQRVDGAAAHGCQVIATPVGTAQGEVPPVRRLRSGSGWSYFGLREGEYRVRAEAKGAASAESTATVRVRECARVDLVLEPAEPTVDGPR